MDPKNAFLQLIAVSPFILIIIIYLTKPNRRRLLGAFAAGIAFGVFNLFADIIAYNYGWWRYKNSINVSYAPLAYYIPPTLVFGCGLALIGWRIERKYHKTGLIIFIVTMSLLGLVRDNWYVKKTGAFYWGKGISPIIMDTVTWAFLYTIAQLVMFFIAGSYKKDKPLAKFKYLFSRSKVLDT
jgi:hypothetical protein